jgi:hypothetical protein
VQVQLLDRIQEIRALSTGEIHLKIKLKENINKLTLKARDMPIQDLKHLIEDEALRWKDNV